MGNGQLERLKNRDLRRARRPARHPLGIERHVEPAHAPGQQAGPDRPVQQNVAVVPAVCGKSRMEPIIRSCEERTATDGPSCCSRHGPQAPAGARVGIEMHDLNRSMDSGIGATGAGRNTEWPAMQEIARSTWSWAVLPCDWLASPRRPTIVFQAKCNPGQDNHQQIGNRAAITDRSATPSGLRSMRTEGSNGSRGG